MFSPIKIALFALISFVTLAVAIPAPEPCHADARALIIGTNVLLKKALLPISMSACLSFSLALLYAHRLCIAHLHSANATSEYVTPVIGEVVEIIICRCDVIVGHATLLWVHVTRHIYASVVIFPPSVDSILLRLRGTYPHY